MKSTCDQNRDCIAVQKLKQRNIEYSYPQVNHCDEDLPSSVATSKLNLLPPLSNQASCSMTNGKIIYKKSHGGIDFNQSNVQNCSSINPGKWLKEEHIKFVEGILTQYK